MRTLTVALLAGLAAVVAATAIPAGAKTPGSSGRIAFAREDPANPGATVTYTANPDGSDVLPLYPGHNSGGPHWSPDGREVAVFSDAGLPCCTVASVVVNPDSGATRVLPMQEPDTLFTGCSIWSPDGARLACEGGGQTDSSLNGIYTIRSSDGGGLNRLTYNPDGDDIPIDYSPDGRQLVFGRTDPTGPSGRNQALFVVNVDGTGARRITPWGFYDDDGSWSPDGTEIAFEHRGSPFVVHPDGTRLTKVALAIDSRFFAGDFTWSPDGTKLVFLLGTQTGPKTFQEGIATANADGSDVQQVTNSPTFDHETDWGTHPVAHS